MRDSTFFPPQTIYSNHLFPFFLKSLPLVVYKYERTCIYIYIQSPLRKKIVNHIFFALLRRTEIGLPSRQESWDQLFIYKERKQKLFRPFHFVFSLEILEDLNYRIFESVSNLLLLFYFLKEKFIDSLVLRLLPTTFLVPSSTLCSGNEPPSFDRLSNSHGQVLIFYCLFFFYSSLNSHLLFPKKSNETLGVTRFRTTTDGPVA